MSELSSQVSSLLSIKLRLVKSPRMNFTVSHVGAVDRAAERDGVCFSGTFSDREKQSRVNHRSEIIRSQLQTAVSRLRAAVPVISWKQQLMTFPLTQGWTVSC